MAGLNRNMIIYQGKENKCFIRSKITEMAIFPCPLPPECCPHDPLLSSALPLSDVFCKSLGSTRRWEDGI
jgi:hypothetical protein